MKSIAQCVIDIASEDIGGLDDIATLLWLW